MSVSNLKSSGVYNCTLLTAFKVLLLSRLIVIMVIDCKVQYRIDIWLYLVFGDDIFVLYIQIKITVNSTENTIISNKGMRTAAVIAPVHELVDFVTTNC